MVRGEHNYQKWEGTGMEAEIYKEYQDPMTRKRTAPLFEKSKEQKFVTLDGTIGYETRKK